MVGCVPGTGRLTSDRSPRPAHLRAVGLLSTTSRRPSDPGLAGVSCYRGPHAIRQVHVLGVLDIDEAVARIAADLFDVADPAVEVAHRLIDPTLGALAILLLDTPNDCSV